MYVAGLSCCMLQDWGTNCKWCTHAGLYPIADRVCVVLYT